MVNLQKVITARGLKQAQAAKLLGVTQPRVSYLMRGRPVRAVVAATAIGR